MRIRKRSRKPIGPPADARAGGDAIIGAAVKLYDRRDGQGADWRAVNEALFHAAFAVLDRLPDDQKRAIGREVHARAYDRMVGNKIDRAIDSHSASPLSPGTPNALPDHRPQ